jgi:hypothetical protein
MGFVAAGDTVTDRHVVTENEIATHPFYAQFPGRLRAALVRRHQHFSGPRA